MAGNNARNEQASRRQWRRVMMMVFFAINAILMVIMLIPYVNDFFPWLSRSLFGSVFTFVLQGIIGTLLVGMNIVGVLFAKMGD